MSINAIVVCAYLVGVIALAVYLSRFIKNDEDFFLAGRSLNKWILAGSIMGTNVAAIYLVGPAAAAFGGGGVSVLLIAWTGNMIAAISALFFVPRLRRMRIMTISEYLEERYGVALRLLPAGLWLLYYACFAGVGMYTLAAVLSPVLGVNPGSLIIVVGTGVLLYCFLAGLLGAAYSSVIEAFLMILGGLILLPLALKQVGGLGGLAQQLPESFFVFWKGGDAGVWPTWKDVVMFIVLGLPYWCTSQYMIQRSFAGRSVREASRGLILAALMTGPLTLSYILPGMCGSVLYTGDTKLIGDSVLPQLLNDFLPVGLGGLFLAGLVAASNSTSSALLSSLATLAEHDFYRRFIPGKSKKHYMRVGRVAILVGGVIGILFAFQAKEGGIIKSSYDLMGFFEPPIFVIVAGALFWKRANTWGAVGAGVVGIAFNFVSRLQFILGMFGADMSGSSLPNLGAAEQTMLCFPVSAVALIVGTFLGEKLSKKQKAGPREVRTLFSGGEERIDFSSPTGRFGVVWGLLSLAAFVACSFFEEMLPKPGSIFIYMGLMMSFVIGCYLAVPVFVAESEEDSAPDGAITANVVYKVIGSGWTWLAVYVLAAVLMVVLYMT